MPLRDGDEAVTAVRVGATPVIRAYQGSNLVFGTPPLPGQPAPPTGVVWTHEQINWSWLEPALSGGTLTGYDLEIRVNDGEGDQQDPGPGTATTFSDTELNAGDRYAARVRARTDDGEGPWSDWSDDVTPIAPHVVAAAGATIFSWPWASPNGSATVRGGSGGGGGGGGAGAYSTGTAGTLDGTGGAGEQSGGDGGRRGSQLARQLGTSGDGLLGGDAGMTGAFPHSSREVDAGCGGGGGAGVIYAGGDGGDGGEALFNPSGDNFLAAGGGGGGSGHVGSGSSLLVKNVSHDAPPGAGGAGGGGGGSPGLNHGFSNVWDPGDRGSDGAGGGPLGGAGGAGQDSGSTFEGDGGNGGRGGDGQTVIVDLDSMAIGEEMTLTVGAGGAGGLGGYNGEHDSGRGFAGATGTAGRIVITPTP